MTVSLVLFHILIEAGTGRRIDLTADDRLNPRFLPHGKIHDTKHGAVVVIARESMPSSAARFTRGSMRAAPSSRLYSV